MNRSLSVISSHQRRLLRSSINPTLVSGFTHRRFFRVTAPRYADTTTSSARPPLPPPPPVKSALSSDNASSSNGSSGATLDATQRQLRNLTIMSATTLLLLAFNFYTTAVTTTITLIDVEQERHMIDEMKKASLQQAESIKRDLQLLHETLAKSDGTGNTTTIATPATRGNATTNNSTSSSAQSKPTGIASIFSGFGHKLGGGGNADDKSPSNAPATSGSGSGSPPKPQVHPSLSADKNIAGTASCPSSPHADVGTKYQSAMLPPLSPDHPQPPLHKADMS